MTATLSHISHSSTGNLAPLVDKVVGSAYDVVREVAYNLEYIKHVSAHLEQVFIVSNNIENIDIIAGNIEAIDNILVHINEILSVHENMNYVITVAENIAILQEIAPHLTGLQLIYQNITQILIVANNIEPIVNVSYSIEAIESISNNLSELLGIYSNLPAILGLNPDFNTRADLVAYVAATPATVSGRLYNAEGLHYVCAPGSSTIPDLPGLIPVAQITPMHFGAKADGLTDDAPACNAAAAYMAARGGGVLWCPKGTYILGNMWDFLVTGYDLEVICEAGAKFIAKAGFPGGDKKLVRLQGGTDCNIKWTGGFFDGRNMPNSLPGEANDVFSCPLANAASLTLSDMIIEAGDYFTTGGSDTCLGAASAKRMSLTRIRCKGAPDAGIYLSGGSVGDGTSRILEELTFDEISVDNCLAGFVVKRRFKRVSGGSCFFTDCGTGLTLGAEASMQDSSLVLQADDMHVSSVVAQRCGYALSFRYARNATAGSVIHTEMGCKITAGSGFETPGAYAVVLQGSQNCIIDSIIANGSNSAIPDIITQAVRVTSYTINSEFRASTDNVFKVINGIGVDSLVNEIDSAQLRNTYGVLKGTYNEGPTLNAGAWADSYLLSDAIISNGLANGLELCLDAADPRSYTVGANWTDRATLTGVVGDHFYLGTDATVQSIDPVFHGIAGGRSMAEYFTFDGTQFFTYTGASNTAWMDAIHKDNAAFTIIAYVYAPDNTSWSLCGTTGASTTAVGFSVNVSSISELQLLVQNGTGTVLDIPSGSTCKLNNSWNFLAVSQNEANASSLLLRVNDTSVAAFNTYLAPSATTAAQIMQIGACGAANNPIAAGNRIGWFAMWSRALTPIEIQALHLTTRRRYNV